MANFITVGYKRDDDKIIRMKISESLKDFVGNAGPPTEKSSNRAKINKRRGEVGTRPRYVVLRRRVGEGENSILKYARVPCATPEIYASKTGTTTKVTYNGNQWDVVTGHPEDVD